VFSVGHRNTGIECNHASVERFVAVQIKKVGAIVGDKGLFLVADDRRQLPVLQAAESAVSDVKRK
jgi:hypothetical protein